jgi:glycosyltransferase involved in cell wall biosynthesis
MNKNQKIKVAMLIQRYHPHIGGAERQLQALAPLLTALDIELHIVTRKLPNTRSFEYIDGIPVYRLPISKSKILSSLSYTITAQKLLNQIRPDLIHAHELLSPTTTAYLAKKIFKIPFVTQVHLGGKDNGEIHRLQKKFLGNLRLNTFSKSADQFIVISREIDQELADLSVSKRKRQFIPNGVDTDLFTPVPIEQKMLLRKQHNMGMDIPLAIIAARLEPQKRPDWIIDIWPEIRKAFPMAELYVLGEGSLKKPLMENAGEGIRFLGGVDDVKPYLQMADVFVLPSMAEGLSIAILEAQACGLPVLASDLSCNLDLINHGINGALFNKNDKNDLKRNLLELFSQWTCLPQMGMEARSHVVNHFSLKATAENLHSLYHAVLEG